VITQTLYTLSVKKYSYLGCTSYAAQLIIHIIQVWVSYSLLSGRGDIRNEGCQKKPIFVDVTMLKKSHRTSLFLDERIQRYMLTEYNHSLLDVILTVHLR